MGWNPWKLRRELNRCEGNIEHLREKMLALHARAGIAEGWVKPSEYIVNDIRKYYDVYQVPKHVLESE